MNTTIQELEIAAGAIKAGQVFITEGISFTAVSDAEDNEYREGFRVSVTKTGGNGMFFRLFGLDDTVVAA